MAIESLTYEQGDELGEQVFNHAALSAEVASVGLRSVDVVPPGEPQAQRYRLGVLLRATADIEKFIEKSGDLENSLRRYADITVSGQKSEIVAQRDSTLEL